MKSPTAVSLKRGPQRRALYGQHIDEALALATKHGYGCNVVYGPVSVPITSAGPRTLTLRIDETTLKVNGVR